MPKVYRNIAEWVFAGKKIVPESVERKISVRNTAGSQIAVTRLESPPSAERANATYFFQVEKAPVMLGLSHRRGSEEERLVLSPNRYGPGCDVEHGSIDIIRKAVIALNWSLPSCPTGPNVVPVHACDHFQLNLFGTHRLAFADISATSETFLIELPYHAKRTLVTLRLPLRQ